MPKIDSNILTAVFGLIGVIVGGFITAGANYILAERRANREESREQRKRIAELKRAARLVDEDFNWVLFSIKIVIERKLWLPPVSEPNRLEMWREYRSLLAAETTFDTWKALQDAAQAMEAYQRVSTKAGGEREIMREIAAADLAVMEMFKAQLEKGHTALKPYLT